MLGTLLCGAVHGAHPLIIEDTGTQGLGRNQIELTLERTRDDEHGVTKGARQHAVVLTHG